MAKLGKVCDVRDGTHDSPKYVDNGFPLITSKNLSSGSIDFSDVNYISEEDYTKINQRSKVDIGDIIMPMIGTIGNPVIVDIEPVFAIKNVSLIKFINEEVYNRYILYVLDSDYFKRYIDDKNRGGTQKFISLNDIREFDFVLPDLLTQRKIASNLDKVTHTIDLCNAILEKLDMLVKSRFVEMFGDMSLNSNRWKQTSLGDACDVRDGTHDSPKYYLEGYPLVTSKNLTDGEIDFTDCSLITEEDYRKINQRSKVDIGDILMPMIGTVGNPVIVNVKAEFAIKNVALIKFREESPVINIFVKALLESDYFDRAVLSKVRGGTQKFISLGDIRKLEFSLPPIELQNQFAAFVEQTDKSKSVVKKLLEKAEMLKKALMQEYFV
ncbi:restriction endonuclease subunit S [Ruminococcus flavefaciens]|uniref:restriction endonuclease subunit S n=1 Tax=Ruminococcus flavefaciens TaxID=1265 RepID=UPI00048C4BE8|nr:restriction endonuclease subunit S [Ruminococcus flavefaciens]